ncbi:uncharacterized protein LOC108096023 [Drosophila ficusphila]|uniref:uncharacterized protein LOC108096023 n=1 Tax=Drosophila ficusphila TaxID=30025 RepID=UPI0007E67B11|nr:uncharacterized protein LOC108096023 [Drosophila ficusphila]
MMDLPLCKKCHTRHLFPAQLFSKGPVVTLRYYKRKPVFRPRAQEPNSVPDNSERVTIEETRDKLMRILRRFDKVDTIIEESRRRINPFQPVVEVPVSYEDIEINMREGIVGWSDYECEDSDDFLDL